MKMKRVLTVPFSVLLRAVKLSTLALQGMRGFRETSCFNSERFRHLEKEKDQ